MASPATSVRAWFDERFPLDDLKALAQKKKVPLHRYSYWYFLGGMTLFLFGVQVLTGALLLLYYRPGADEAFESVQFIMTQVQFGWLVRSVHSWSANLLVFMAFAHLFSVLFLKSYRKPRELTWVSGMLLLFLMLGFGFSGYLLPWNTLSYFATKVGTRDTCANTDHRPSHSAVPAGRRRHHRQHADAALRLPRGDIAGTGDIADRRAPGTNSMVRHERAAQR